MAEEPHIVRRAKSTGFANPPVRPARGGTWQGHSPAIKKDNPTKPLINWLARKLGQNRGTRSKVAEPHVATSHSSSADGPRSILARGLQTPPSIPLPRARQRSTVATPSIRLSTHRPGSTKTRNSGRSYQPSSIFSPARNRAGPRASFITRSSASPTHSPSLSPSSSLRSLASSYLALEDPDARSYVATLDLPDENASTQPIPPSRPHSPALSAANSLPSSVHFQADLHRGMLHASSLCSQSFGKRSRSASQATSVSSFGSPGKTVRSTPSLVSTKPTTIFSTESDIALGLGLPFAQIAVPPRPMAYSQQIDDLVRSSEPAGEDQSVALRDTSQLAEPLAWTSLSALLPGTHSIRPLNNSNFSASVSEPSSPDASRSAVQVPGYSYHYPQHNPPPNSIPHRDASTHTLASSTFALSTVAHMEDAANHEPVDAGSIAAKFDRNTGIQEGHLETRYNPKLYQSEDANRTVGTSGTRALTSTAVSPHLDPVHTHEGDQPDPEMIFRLNEYETLPRSTSGACHEAAKADSEYARILHAASGDRASLIGLRGRRVSRDSDTSDASRFSWAAASMRANPGEAGQMSNMSSRPSSTNSNVPVRPILGRHVEI